MDTEPRDLLAAPLHLGLGATAVPLDGFSWDPEHLEAMDDRFASDGDEGRLVTLFPMEASWTSWERHPAGEEVVVLLEGRCRLWQEVDGTERSVELGAGQYVVNPPGVWHTADVIEPGRGLFITPGRGTEHRPR
jgi:quercetin dioxygenase-like cupin family protein